MEGWMRRHLESTDSVSLYSKAGLTYVCVYLFITNFLHQPTFY